MFYRACGCTQIGVFGRLATLRVVVNDKENLYFVDHLYLSICYCMSKFFTNFGDLEINPIYQLSIWCL